MALNSTKTKLLASCQDHHLYVFDCILPEQEPVTFSGHINNSFYVKSSFSPDDQYIVSGSSDYDVYIWDLSHPLLPPIRLKGHGGEVSDVEWCPTDFCKLATSSDDTTVRIWNIERSVRAEATDAFHGRGSAVVPDSWSLPSSQSEDDFLACRETMIHSQTSWPSTTVPLGPSSRADGPSPSGMNTPHAFIQQPSVLGCISPSCQSPSLKQATLHEMWHIQAFTSSRARLNLGSMDIAPPIDMTPLLAGTRERKRSRESAGGGEGVDDSHGDDSGDAFAVRTLK